MSPKATIPFSGIDSPSTPDHGARDGLQRNMDTRDRGARDGLQRDVSTRDRGARIGLQRDVSTRDRLLAYLEENRAATVSGLSRLWGMTPAGIRYHLADLVKEGLVEVIPVDPAQPARRGRPVQAYRLTIHSTPDNLAALCAAALDLLLIEPDRRETVLRNLAARLCAGTVPSTGATQRFNQAVAFLNQHAYRARWEAGAQGPRVLLRSCPYAAILAEHPELCQVDHYLLECLLKVPVSQEARMNLSTGKPPACVFSA